MNSTVESSSVATTSVAVAQEPNVKIAVPESTTKDVKIAVTENSSSSITVSEPVVTDETTTDVTTGEVTTGDVTTEETPVDESAVNEAAPEEAATDEVGTDEVVTDETATDTTGTDDALVDEMPVEEVISDGGYIEPGYTGELGEGTIADPGMGQVKDPLLSNWFFVIGISVAVLFVSIALGTLLARRKIKKGIEIYED